MEFGFIGEEDCAVDEFVRQLKRKTRGVDVPFAATIEQGIPVYNADKIIQKLNAADASHLLAEWATVFGSGAGVLVIKNMVSDHTLIDDVSDVFCKIIADQAAVPKGEGEGDHFAPAGSNARIWNSAQKLCLAAPELFARYHGNTVIDAVCRAWLGPAYQMTAQVNLVRPGGAAQSGHRDFHLGFQTANNAMRWPTQVHRLSPLLTLQGAIAHCDMPLESGPTRLLPWSQQFTAGYVAMQRREFQAVFEKRYVQLPLNKGDGLFFNPALFHAAGENRSSNIERLANLLQVSSGFGRAMESLDRTAMVLALYPALRRVNLSAANCAAAIAACAEGYPFPTNLDNDPPLDGLAPQTQAELMRQALTEKWDDDKFAKALAEQSKRRLA